jgi:hypothetical protein
LSQGTQRRLLRRSVRPLMSIRAARHMRLDWLGGIGRHFVR